MKNWNAKESEVYEIETGNTVARCDIGGKDEKTEANSKLIAAAPELLEALEMAKDQLIFINKNFFPTRGIASSYVTLRSIDAAIEKAKG